MTTRIDKRFAELRIEGRAALVTFLMCGDPDLDTSLQLIEALPGAGADVIEIGDKKLLLEVTGGEPTVKDRVLAGGVDYAILGVAEIGPAGTPVVYTLHLRS